MVFKSLTLFPVTMVALFLTFSSCKKDDQLSEDYPPTTPGKQVNKNQPDYDATDSIGYDIILVIGQSNTHSGLGLDTLVDKADSSIFQLGRFAESNGKIIPAIEPLEHFTRHLQKIGFALPFAKIYKRELLKKDRKVLIIPCGMGDTGFRKQRWNKGDDLYQDAVNRSNQILKYHPKSRMTAILWHQGEADLNNLSYQSAFDKMIRSIRTDIKSGMDQKLPFIVGGMVPFWVDQDNSRTMLENIIKQTPVRVEFTGYADPRNPFLIQKSDNSTDETHYEATGQREFAKRYYTAFLKIYSASVSKTIVASL